MTRRDSDKVEELYQLGLSEEGVLQSTGIGRHRARLASGEVSTEDLEQYAADLRTLDTTAALGGAPIPIDFWDVRSPAMEVAGLTEYALNHRLSTSEHVPYIELLGRAYGRLIAFKRGVDARAVATALDLLVDCTDYVRAGHALPMAAVWPRLRPEAAAILLWQQITTGTSRAIHGHEIYTHSFWGRFNVIEMWNYETRTEESVSDVWGLSGFDDMFIGDPHNANQIEHMAISAVAQMALRIPLFLLNLLETVEWLTRRCSLAEARADQALNRAVAHDLRRNFTLEDPQIARDRLERTLGIGQ